MQFTACDIAGAWIIEPAPREDERGRFMRAWCSREFDDHHVAFAPVQSNMVLSTRTGTVRGMHFQVAPALEAKLVRCTRGRVYDVVIDLRPDSPTCGRWFGIELNAKNARMMYVPEHCAHGFQALEGSSEIYYLTSAFYTPHSVRGVRFDDPALGIDWPLKGSVVSDQDRSWPLIERLEGHRW